MTHLRQFDIAPIYPDARPGRVALSKHRRHEARARLLRRGVLNAAQVSQLSLARARVGGAAQDRHRAQGPGIARILCADQTAGRRFVVGATRPGDCRGERLHFAGGRAREKLHHFPTGKVDGPALVRSERQRIGTAAETERRVGVCNSDRPSTRWTPYREMGLFRGLCGSLTFAVLLRGATAAPLPVTALALVDTVRSSRGHTCHRGLGREERVGRDAARRPELGRRRRRESANRCGQHKRSDAGRSTASRCGAQRRRDGLHPVDVPRSAHGEIPLLNPTRKLALRPFGGSVQAGRRTLDGFSRTRYNGLNAKCDA